MSKIKCRMNVEQRSPNDPIRNLPSALRNSLSRFRPRESLKIVPLASALQRVVLAEWKSGKFLGHQDPPQVRMAVEPDAEHVKRFPLEPIGSGPQRDHRRNRQ